MDSLGSNYGDDYWAPGPREYSESCGFSFLDQHVKIIGSSVVGQSHISQGKPRDDAMKFMAVNQGGNDYYLIAVSDGAGSRSRSRIGSTFLVNHAVELWREAIKGDLFSKGDEEALRALCTGIFDKLHEGLKDHADSLSLDKNDLAATLLMLVYVPSLKRLVCGQIGDGFIVGLDYEGHARELVQPPPTGQAGAAFFLSMNGYQRVCAVKTYIDREVEQLKTFFIASDGIADDASYPPPDDILHRWANALDRNVRNNARIEETEKAFHRWLTEYQAKGSYDDRTLVVAAIQNGSKA